MRALIVSHGRAASCTVASLAVHSPSSLAARKSAWIASSRERDGASTRKKKLFPPTREKRRARDRTQARPAFRRGSSHSPSCAPRRDVEMRETLKTRRPNTQGKKNERGPAGHAACPRTPARSRATVGFRQISNGEQSSKLENNNVS